MPATMTPKKTLSLKRRVIRDLNDRDRLLASQGYSLWTCPMERPDPLTPVVNPVEVERVIEREVEIDREIEIERDRPQRGS